MAADNEPTSSPGATPGTGSIEEAPASAIDVSSNSIGGPGANTGFGALNPPVRVLLGERHAHLRRILVRSITCGGACTVVGEAANSSDVVRLSTQLNPDVILLDLYLAGLTNGSGAESPNAFASGHSVIILSSDDEPEFAIRALKSGARGFVLKHNADAELLKAVRVVHCGGIFVSKSLWSELVSLFP